MQNLMVVFNYSFFDQKYQFWGNLVQKIKIICLKWKLVPRLIRICRLEWSCLLFLFYIKNIFLGKLGSKNQNYQFKQKFDTYTNSNMQNSMVVFTFSALDRDNFFWQIWSEKVKIVCLSWSLVPKLILIFLRFNRCLFFPLSTKNTLFW